VENRDIPEAIKLLMQWSLWIAWDYSKTKQKSILDDNYNARLWLWSYMNHNNITENIAKEVTDKNHLSMWFKIEKSLNKKSLSDMKHTNYDLKYLRGKFEMVDLTAPKK
jgi:hypothetical protein